jgi:hypothetical protein
MLKCERCAHVCDVHRTKGRTAPCGRLQMTMLVHNQAA